MLYDYCKQRKKHGLAIMDDRKEERRDRFDRKKKFKKETRSSKAKAQRKQIKRKEDDRIFMGYALEY